MGSPTIIDWEFEDPGVLEQERFYEVIRPALEGCELPEVSLTLKGPETLRSHLLRTIVGWARKP